MVSKSWIYLLSSVVLVLVLALGCTYYLGRGGALLSTSTLFVSGEFAAEEPSAGLPEDTPDRLAKNLILFIGDGMGPNQIALARATTVGYGGRLAMEGLPVVGLVSTQPIGRAVTDSAAAATALATGCKTLVHRVSVDEAGRTLGTVLEAARASGRRAGLVTTSYLVDATPASFGAHAQDRDEGEAIAAQFLDAGIEVLLGGDEGLFNTVGDDGGATLLARARDQGYRVAEGDPGELPAAVAEALRDGSGKLLGLFSGEDLILPDDPQPALADLTTAALEVLQARTAEGPGFFLLVEHEGPDTWGHRQAVQEMSASVRQLDEAVQVGLDFAAADGQTLVLVTGDHETGGLQVIEGRDRELKILWASGYHTAGQVPIFASGPGAQAFGGVLDNTHVARRMATALGLELEACP